MKKTIKIFGIVALFATVLFTSCKKEDATTPNETGGIKPIEEAMDAQFDWDGFETSPYNYNYAIGFKTSKAGKITQIGARIGKGTYNIAIIDSSSSSVLKSSSITVTDSSKFNYTDIEDVAIQANKTYYLSINVPAGAYALYYYIPNGEFPITVGSFTYINSTYRTTSGTNATDIFRDDFTDLVNTLVGIPSFMFVEN